MRSLWAIAVIMALAFSAVPSALADTNINEHGFGVLLNIGSEKRPISGNMIFKDMYGNVLQPNNKVLCVPQCECVNGWITFEGSTTNREYEVRYSTMGNVADQNLKEATWDPLSGYRVVLTPEDTIQTAGQVRWFHLKVRRFGGRKDWFRVIFKITYGSGSVFTSTSLAIVTYDRANTPQARESAALSALSAQLQQTAAYATKLNERVTNLEGYAQGLGSGSGSSTSSGGQMVNFTVSFQGWNAIGKTVTISGVSRQVTSNDMQWSLPAGNYQIVVPMPDGRNSLPANLSVSAGMTPVVIDYRRAQ